MVLDMVKHYKDTKRRNPLLPVWGYFYILAAKDLLYQPSNRPDSIYHNSCGVLAKKRKEGNVLFNDALNTF